MMGPPSFDDQSVAWLALPTETRRLVVKLDWRRWPIWVRLQDGSEMDWDGKAWTARDRPDFTRTQR